VRKATVGLVQQRGLAKNWLTVRSINFCLATRLQLSTGLYKFGDINNNELLIINLAAVPGWVCHEKRDSKILFRNCINDGRRSIAHVLQRECANRPKVLYSKDKVLSVEVKRSRTYGIR